MPALREREDGALVGPWNRWLHEPAIGKANLVGLYDLVSTTLNGFNVPVPERE